MLLKKIFFLLCALLILAGCGGTYDDMAYDEVDDLFPPEDMLQDCLDQAFDSYYVDMCLQIYGEKVDPIEFDLGNYEESGENCLVADFQAAYDFAVNSENFGGAGYILCMNHVNVVHKELYNTCSGIYGEAWDVETASEICECLNDDVAYRKHADMCGLGYIQEVYGIYE